MPKYYIIVEFIDGSKGTKLTDMSKTKEVVTKVRDGGGIYIGNRWHPYHTIKSISLESLSRRLNKTDVSFI